MLKRLCGFLICLTVFCSVVSAQISSSARLNVRLVPDEAEAVLAILAKRKAGQEVSASDWQRVFQSEGYVRLKKRETSMQRSFADDAFKQFVLSEQLLQRMAALEETLARWKNVDSGRAGRLALAYLPPNANIQAKIYPVIKPRDNSFVFDVKTDPAIFLYLDPAVTREKFENTLAHELHHIGFGSACPRKDIADKFSKLPQNRQTLLTWLGAFGEGFSFFGTQGPWYTVGWRMAVLIERVYGRAKLIECMCDQRTLLSTYNRAAKQLNRKLKSPLALWSAAVVEPIKN